MAEEQALVQLMDTLDGLELTKSEYTAAILQEILLGLHSMCKGAESKFFNGHTNVTSSRFVVFGVKGLLQASKNVRSAMLFNVLS